MFEKSELTKAQKQKAVFPDDFRNREHFVVDVW